MIQPIYFPACSSGAYEKFLKNEEHFRFYKKGNIFHHPFMLISAGINKNQNLKEDYGLDGKQIILGDSGGFQIATEQIKFNESVRDNIFQWLEKSTNYAINLDIPPYVSSVKNKKGIDFKGSLESTVENMKYFEKKQSGSTKYLNVLHGRSYEEKNQWYEQVKDFKFTGGWACGSVSYNLYQVLESLFFLMTKGEFDRYNKKDKFIHMLGASNLFMVIPLTYFQKVIIDKKYECNISFDSSSPILHSVFGRYVLDINFYYHNMVIIKFPKNKEFINNLNGEGRLPCDCPVCKRLKFDAFKMNYGKKTNGEYGYNSDIYGLVFFHNFYKYLEIQKKINALIFSNSREIYKNVFNQTMLNIFNVIDECFDDIKNYRKILYLRMKTLSLFDSGNTQKESICSMFK